MKKLPSRAWLRGSLALWRRRAAYRKLRHDHYQRLLDHARAAKAHPYGDLVKQRDHWSKLLLEARKEVSLRRRQLGPTGHASGIDVSSYQGTVDWAKVKAAGYSFVFVKLTQGTTYVNPDARRQVEGARSHGLLVGGYHFLEHGDVAGQAKHFAAQLKALGFGEGGLLPAQDVEEAGAATPTTTDAAGFCGALLRLVGVAPLLYTSPGFARWSTRVGSGLWVAHYGVKSPTIPAPWLSYACWQWSSKATVPGVDGQCDVDRTEAIERLVW